MQTIFYDATYVEKKLERITVVTKAEYIARDILSATPRIEYTIETENEYQDLFIDFGTFGEGCESLTLKLSEGKEFSFCKTAHARNPGAIHYVVRTILDEWEKAGIVRNIKDPLDDE